MMKMDEIKEMQLSQKCSGLRFFNKKNFICVISMSFLNKPGICEDEISNETPGIQN